jgi:hypothetical protein
MKLLPLQAASVIALLTASQVVDVLKYHVVSMLTLD